MPEGDRRAASGSGSGVTDGTGAVVPDAPIETWQADPDGRFAHPADGDGGDDIVPRIRPLIPRRPRFFAILTRKPGRLVPRISGGAHIDVTIFARRLVKRGS